jgi:methyltransferase (TIGR00027 family)
MLKDQICNVSDTALLVAMYRAHETKREDALFQDPFAERLAGDRGKRIIAELKTIDRDTGWPLIVRTRIIDDLILSAISDGVDRVINLAAGLDTRPYRLALPESLPWIEADLPAMIEDKDRALADEKPRCKLSREKVDLADPAARSAFLDRALAGARSALVLTEGLLVYLTDEEVRGIARDLVARPEVRWWMIDLISPETLKQATTRVGENAAMKFAPPDGVAFFRPLGWKPREIFGYLKQAAKWKRAPIFLRPFALLPDPNYEKFGDRSWGGVVRFEKI